MIKLREGIFNYIEDELMHYHTTMSEIDRMRRDILFGSTTSNNSGGSRTNLVSDPTAWKGIELAENYRIQRMEKITDAIGCVFERLQPEKKQLIQLIYWERPRIYTWQGAAMRLHITKRTAYRWRREIIHAIAERGGFY